MRQEAETEQVDSVKETHRVFVGLGEQGGFVRQAGQEQRDQQQEVVDIEGGVPPHRHCPQLERQFEPMELAVVRYCLVFLTI